MKLTTYKGGFTLGLIIGAFLDLVAKGIIVIGNVLPEQVKGVFRVVWFLGLAVTLYRAYKRRSMFSTRTDGLIQGFLAGSAMISVYFGRFPFT